jgi:hypothetical protein
MTTICAKFDPKAKKFIDQPDQQTPKIKTELIPPLEMKLLVQTIYKAAERFYAIPGNLERFEAWQKERKVKEGIVHAENS